MPKNGDVISGRFREIIDPNRPVVWDEEAKFFAVPTADAPAPVKRGRYFDIPVQPAKSTAKYFQIPTPTEGAEKQ